MKIPIIGDIIKGVSDFLVSWNNGRTKIAEAKIEAKVAKYQAQANYSLKQLEAEKDWDVMALRQSSESWKDEWLLFIWTMPFIGSFIPVVQDYVLSGWGYIKQAPVWYQVGLLGMVAASFGLRWWFNRNKLKVIKGVGDAD